MAEPALAYLTARIRGRWRTLPNEAAWCELEAIGHADAVLEAARGGALQPWLQGVTLMQGSAGVEQQLRRRWLTHVDEVAHWVPKRWVDATRWTGHLMRLPALDHLLRGGAPPAWALSDDLLAPLGATTGKAIRRTVLAKGALAPLARSDSPADLRSAWLAHWRHLWPELDAMEYAVEQLTTAWNEAAPLGIRRLRQACRRTAPAPASAFLHLGLAAIHLHRLRALLVRRLLFPEQAA